MSIGPAFRAEQYWGEPGPDVEMAVPDMIPEWLLDAPVSVEEPGHCCTCPRCVEDARPRETEPVRWAVPGVWDEPAPVTVGPLVAQLQQLVRALDAVDPTALPRAQALVEAEAVAGLWQRVRVQLLARIGDVHERGLFRERDFRTTRTWLEHVAPDAVLSDVTLAKRLPDLPHVTEALQDGALSIKAASRIGKAMASMRPHLDRPDGLIDGLPGEEVVAAVVDDTVDVIGRDRCGLVAEDPADAAVLADLEQRTSAIHDGGGSQAGRLEQACVLRGTELTAAALPTALEDVVLAVVPSLLEQREKDAQAKRALSLARNDDGTWDVDGTLTPECGEALWTLLGAEARRDPANPLDTAVRADARQAAAASAGRDPWSEQDRPPEWESRALRESELLPDVDALVPRSRSKRVHDALLRGLQRYLSTGLGGVHGKVPVQLTATLSSAVVDGSPGARPARAASGRALSRALLRAWWCDAHVTTLLMRRGWTPLGVVHSARTITATETKAARVQFDNRCAGTGCCAGLPDPLIPLLPHHVRDFATHGRTSLWETVLLCHIAHQDIHLGKKTLRLRNGRLLNENGWVDADN